MKLLLYFFTIICFLGCTREYIVMPNVKGRVYSKVDKKPINGVEFFVSKFAINNFDTIKTDEKGRFLVFGWFENSHSNVRKYAPIVQQVFFLKKDQTYKYINVKKYYNKEDYNKKDTIDLGIVYFEDLKSIEKDSIPE